MNPIRGVAPPAAPARDERAQLRRMAHQLEAVFLAQLFQAMRESVPQDAEAQDAGGQEMFRSMFDDQVATEAAGRSERGLGEALYRQLSRRLAAGDPPAGHP